MQRETMTAMTISCATAVVLVLLSHWMLRGRIDGVDGTSAESAAKIAGTLNAVDRRMDALEEKLREVETETGRAKTSLSTLSRDTETRIRDAAQAMVRRDELNAAVDTLRTDIAVLEAYWARQGTIVEPITQEVLAQGYALRFDGQGTLGLNPRGNVLKTTDPAGLAFADGGHLRSAGPAAALSKPLTDTGEFSIYIDLKATDLNQRGPARILSNSRDTAIRNVTIGQQNDRFVVRLRTTETNPNGDELRTFEEAVTGERQRLLYVRQGDKNTLFVDGELFGERTIPGDLRVWDHSFPLLLADENTADRQWLGEIYKVIVFGRPVTVEEAEAAADRVPETP